MKQFIRNFKLARNNNRTNKGITLIALVITIIILLILAGVSIGTLTGENGILNKATKAREETKKESAKEKIELEVLGSLDDNGKLDIDELKEKFKKHLNISDSDITTNEDGSLTVKLDGYVFEISEEGKVTQKGTYENTDQPIQNGGWNGDKKVNPPNLMNNELTACYWDESENEVTGDTGENWYQYVAGDNETDTKTSKWANEYGNQWSSDRNIQFKYWRCRNK
ncbi:MAG: hypothetical protein HFJ34_03810 [Clostridia bacterium]|nr:hypothetical protein [Clostridia bacterium]